MFSDWERTRFSPSPALCGGLSGDLWGRRARFGYLSPITYCGGLLAARSFSLMRPILVSLAACVVLAVAGCGANSDAADAPESAAQVAKALADLIPQAEPSIVYDEQTDPNDLLGRPNGYDSKAALTDSRVPDAKVKGISKGDVELGGGVEVFGTAEEAGRRAEYLDKLQSSAPELLGTDYLYVSGPTLLRVSGLLTPKQAREYEEALGVALDSPVASPNGSYK